MSLPIRVSLSLTFLQGFLEPYFKAKMLRNGTRPRNAGRVLKCTLVLLAALSSNFGAPVHAQEEDTKKTDSNLIVRCVQENEEPVEYAEVYVFQNDGEKYVQSGPFTTDMAGEVYCGKAVFHKGECYDRWIYARMKGKLVGVSRSVQFPGVRKPFNPKSIVTLFPSRSVKGVVEVPDGYDVTKVNVRVNNLNVRTGDKKYDFQSWPRNFRFPNLDTGLKEIFECNPAKDGTFEFHDLPVKGRLGLTTVAQGCGQAQWHSEDWIMEPDAKLVVEPEVPVSGKLKLPDGKPAIGYKVFAQLESGPPYEPSYLASFFAKTSETGEFSIENMPRARFVFYVECDDDTMVFMPKRKLISKVGEPLELDIKLENSILVTGRVTDSKGKPVPSAHLSAVPPDVGSGVGLGGATTDKLGVYQLRVPATKIAIYFNSLPDGFEYPDPQVIKTLDLDGTELEVKNEDFVLEDE